MPVVPVTSSPQVGTAPSPSLRAPAEAFGGGSAARPLDLGGVGEVASQIYHEEKQKADQIALLDSAGKLSAGETALLHDQQNGVLNMRGKDAADAITHARNQYDQMVANIGGGLTNDAQKLAFQRMAEGRWAAINEQVQSHMAAERERYDKATYTGFVGNEINAAVASALNDPKRVDEAVGNVRAATEDYGKRNGWAPEQIQQAQAAAVSTARMGVLERLLDHGDDRAASTYFAAHRDEITGPDQAKVEKALQASSTLGEAQRTVDRILTPPAEGATVSPTDALAQAEAIEDPKVRQEATQMVMAHFNNLDRTQRLERESARARLMSSMEANNGRLNKGSLDWQLVDGHPEGEQLLERQHQILHPPRDPGDPDKYNSFVAMAATSPATRQALLTTNIADIVNDETMSPGQKTAVINLIKSERQRDVTDLRRQANEAQQEVKRLQSVFTKAQKDGDDSAVETNTPLLFAAQQKATVLRGQLQTVTRSAHPAAADETSAPTESTSAPARTAANPVGLHAEPLKPLTPDMAHDLAQYGEGYANYLRTMGYAVPAAVPTPPHAAAAPTPAATPLPAPATVVAPSRPAAPAPVTPPAPQVKKAAPTPAAPVAAPAKTETKQTTAPVVLRPERPTGSAPAPADTKSAPSGAVPAPGTPYEKSGHMVVDTPRPDAAGHVPTHRLDQPTNRRADESWTQYEDRVLGEKSKPEDKKVRNDLASLEPDVREAATQLVAAAKAAGHSIEPNETLRTQGRQEHLFRQGRTPNAKSGTVTWTLTSDHSTGRAIDFGGNAKALLWLEKNAPKFGFTTLGDLDPGHVSMPKGTRSVATSEGRK